MKNRTAAIILVLIITPSLFADRELERDEIVKIAEHLTSVPRDTWISEGTIEASLKSFNSTTNHTTESTEIVKYDGNRFYWEIDIVSDRGGNQQDMAEQADIYLNQKRIFTWDGQWYSMYFKSAKRVMATDDLTNTPPTITGCLKAGVVPWGYGVYSYKNLMSSRLSATETESEGQKLIHLTIKNPGGAEITVVLDPTKDYAVLSSLVSFGSSCSLQEYSNYTEKNGRWIPAAILIERYSDCQKSQKLISYDYWTFKRVSTERPTGAIFNAVYENDTLIEYRPKSAEKSLFCQHSSRIGDRDLLYKKLLAASDPNKAVQNCAVSALRYVIESLGANISDSNFAAEVNEVNTVEGGTSLLAMQQFVSRAGLQSLAIRTDVRHLSDAADYKTILYLPWNKHYVVFSHIENDNVWVIDLANYKFCYSLPFRKFISSGTEANSVVLLVSDKAIDVRGKYTEISSEELATITGSSEPGYSCTELIQAYDIGWCEPGIGVACWGRYTIWYNRYGCKEDESGGECESMDLVGSVFTICIEDPYYPGSCTHNGYWYPKYIRACR